jgi:rhomboid family GlyGly-CTERM serine protease
VSRGAVAWCVVAGTLAVLATLLWRLPRESLDWQPTLAFEQPWRAWSAAFAHWSGAHLAANLAGCVVVALFGVAADVPLPAAAAWLMAWPLGHALLALQPALTHYGGLSGVLHAGVAVAALHLVWHTRGRPRAIGAAVALGLLLKLLLEAPWGTPSRVWPGWDIPVAPLAHATGAAAGLVCAVLAFAMRRSAAR